MMTGRITMEWKRVVVVVGGRNLSKIRMIAPRATMVKKVLVSVVV